MDIPYRAGKKKSNNISFLPKKDKALPEAILPFIEKYLPTLTKTHKGQENTWAAQKGGMVNLSNVVGKGKKR
jgi:hypothetical protein